jgi:hypothetical protein
MPSISGIGGNKPFHGKELHKHTARFKNKDLGIDSTLWVSSGQKFGKTSSKINLKLQRQVKKRTQIEGT